MQAVNVKAYKSLFRWAWGGAMAVLLASALAVGAFGQEISKELQVKAAFVYNFTHFVHWPDSVFPGNDAPFIIGIIGEDPFGSFLDELVSNESIGSHPLTVVRYQNADAIRDCHILFINLRTPQEILPILKAFSGKAVLTVSDADDFTKIGGMIWLRKEDGRIKLRVNVEPVERSSLVMSSKLLRLAEVIQAQSN